MKPMKRIFIILLSLLLLLQPGSPLYARAETVFKGDIDGVDGVTAADARLALRQAVGLEALSSRQLAAARVTGSKTVTAADARIILRMAVGLADYESERENAVNAMLSSMTTEQKLAQMIMPAVRYFDGEPVTVLNASLSAMLKKHSFAGVILFAQSLQTAGDAARLTDAIQRANARSGRPQLLICTDQEGGKITRLGTGTQTPGNMALGAIGDAGAAREAAGIIGAELAAVGINVDLGPVTDVNSDPSNPVIGVRSFSDRPALAAELGRGYVRGLQDQGIVSTLKHFPGHGDTGTDSHTGLPVINKDLDELMRTDLVPFAAAIDEGAQMVMTAHIRFPKIETQTAVSKSTGARVSLPATLSKTMITDVLRGRMGFQGVVITDAMGMDAIADHFSVLEASRLAINAGVDILLTPVDVSSDAGIAAQEKYLQNLVSMAKSGGISMDAVNAAVRRILRLKYDNGLFSAYANKQPEALAAEAERTVGCRAHHEKEWALAKRAVTLVKNADAALPVRAAGKRILLLAAYPNEELSLQYGAGRLRDEGKLPANAVIETDCYASASRERILSEIRAADVVIAVSELYRAAALDPRTDAGKTGKYIDEMIRTAHGAGAKFVLISAHLPYDAARFQAADAILICWSDMGMSEDPRTQGDDLTQYGPNIPAAVYLALSPDESPAGKLPLDLPMLTSEYTYSSKILYPFGYGLEY
ncbi:MAG: glycoside hydrolase family 3 C-terminal domain-containing protein [Clostridia bacterium]|nr:glycoside hydrolase family 3 C-terminal domain-containing protein [Clostridia bacterium]